MNDLGNLVQNDLAATEDDAGKLLVVRDDVQLAEVEQGSLEGLWVKVELVGHKLTFLSAEDLAVQLLHHHVQGQLQTTPLDGQLLGLHTGPSN